MCRPAEGVCLEGQWHFEYGINLAGIGCQRERWLYQRHHGRDVKSRARDVNRQLSDHFDMLRVQTDFFFGLSQRRCEDAVVVRIDFAAREGDLAGVGG